MNKLFKNLTKGMEKVGDAIDSAANELMEGAMESAKSTIKLVDKLAFDGSKGSVIDLIQLLSIRQSVAKSMYPTVHIEEVLKEDPGNDAYRVALLEVYERRFNFSMKLIKLLSLTPFSREMGEKSIKIIEEEKEEKADFEARRNELILLQDRVGSKLDLAIKNEDIVKLREYITTLIKIKILLKNEEGINKWLELSSEIINEGEFEHLKGRYLLSFEKYELSLPHLEKAYSLNETYSEDDLAECLDCLIEKSSGDAQQKWKDHRNKLFPYIAGNELLERFKGVPSNFLLVKKKEIEKILHWGRNEKTT